MGVILQSLKRPQGLGRCLQWLSLDTFAYLISSSFDKASKAWNELNGPCVNPNSLGRKCRSWVFIDSIAVIWTAQPTPCSALKKKKKSNYFWPFSLALKLPKMSIFRWSQIWYNGGEEQIRSPKHQFFSYRFYLSRYVYSACMKNVIMVQKQQHFL